MATTQNRARNIQTKCHVFSSKSTCPRFYLESSQQKLFVLWIIKSLPKISWNNKYHLLYLGVEWIYYLLSTYIINCFLLDLYPGGGIVTSQYLRTIAALLRSTNHHNHLSNVATIENSHFKRAFNQILLNTGDFLYH